jgi:hypothetical protein
LAKAIVLKNALLLKLIEDKYELEDRVKLLEREMKMIAAWRGGKGSGFKSQDEKGC